MTYPSNDELRELLRAALAEAMAAHGFTTPSSQKVRWGRWFVPNGSDRIPGVEAGITASIGDHESGRGLSVKGFLNLDSTDVTAVLAGLPTDAYCDSVKEYRLSTGYIDGTEFGGFVEPKDYALRQSIGDVDRIQPVVDWFVEFSTKPAVVRWLDERNSLDNLVALATTPSRGSTDNINPYLIRCVPILCLLNGRAGDAATMIRWYTDRDRYNFQDSRKQAVEFDKALAERYPEYAAAREDRQGR